MSNFKVGDKVIVISSRYELNWTRGRAPGNIIGIDDDPFSNKKSIYLIDFNKYNTPSCWVSEGELMLIKDKLDALAYVQKNTWKQLNHKTVEECFKHIKRSMELQAQPKIIIKDNIEQHDCHCNIQDLFNFGCKCGGK